MEDFVLDIFLLSIAEQASGQKVTTVGPNDGVGVPTITFNLDKDEHRKSMAEFATRYYEFSYRLRFLLLFQDHSKYNEWLEIHEARSHLKKFTIKNPEGSPQLFAEVSHVGHLPHLALSCHIKTQAIPMVVDYFGSQSNYEGNIAQYVGNLLKQQGVEATEREIEDGVRREEKRIATINAWHDVLLAFKDLNDYLKANIETILAGSDDQLKFDF
jgi:hypothetical protein